MTQTEPAINGRNEEKWSGMGFRQLAAKAVSALLPQRCYSCGVIVGAAGGLCGECWGEITFITAPQCQRCGRPFEYEPMYGRTDGLECGDCLRKPPVYNRARSCMVYEEACRAFILGFKYADRTDMAPILAEWLIRPGQELLADADLITPVPLHWTRLFSRKFNQSAELARHLAARSGVVYDPDLIRRKRRTESQAGLRAKARAKNVRGAFAVSKKAALRISGKRILLIDDVMTTGATLNACAGVLFWAGASGVDVLTLARVVRAERE